MRFLIAEPHPIRNLAAETLNTTSIKLKWDKPTEYKETYIYQIQTSGCASQNYNTTHEEITITNLTAGTNCLFNVYVQTSDDVKGEKKSIFKYTSKSIPQNSPLLLRTHNAQLPQFVCSSAFLSVFLFFSFLTVVIKGQRLYCQASQTMARTTLS